MRHRRTHARAARTVRTDGGRNEPARAVTVLYSTTMSQISQTDGHGLQCTVRTAVYSSIRPTEWNL